MKRVSILMVIMVMTMTSCQEDKKVPVDGITLNQSEQVMIAVGKTLELTAILHPAHTTERRVVWTSSNANVATVIGGVVTGKLPGLATIVATTANGISASVDVMVAVLVTGITLNDPPEVMLNKTSPAITYSVEPRTATIKGVRWSSSNPAVATVDPVTGAITGVKADQTVTITATSIEGGHTDSREIYVLNSIPITGVKLDKKTLELEVNDANAILPETATLSYSVTPVNTSEPQVIWSSSNKDVATVDEETGFITAIKPGKVTITVKAVYADLKDECALTVMHPNLLKSPGFETPNDQTTTLPTPWVSLAGNNAWFSDYYPAGTLWDPAWLVNPKLGNSWPGNVGTGSQSPARVHSSSTEFNSGNQCGDLKPMLTGNYAFRILNGNGAGGYQLITVEEGVTYVFGADVGYRVHNDNNQIIKTGERLKILGEESGKWTKNIGWAVIPVNNILPGTGTNNPTYVISRNVNNEVTIPAGVTQVRFHFDQRNWANPYSAPVMLVDQCYFRKKLDD